MRSYSPSRIKVFPSLEAGREKTVKIFLSGKKLEGSE
jgi:hypothetical protein